MKMEVNPYLSFNGQCEAAFKFYQECLGPASLSFHKYGGSPMADQVPAEWHDKVMHATLIDRRHGTYGSRRPADTLHTARRFRGVPLHG